jgi:transcriptional regulator with XRE-family HTH domain
MKHITVFGEEVRRLRMAGQVSLKAMAEGLGVSSAYLSSVESGRKKIPDEFVERIVGFFKLRPREAKNLSDAAEASQPQYKIDVSDCDGQARETVAMFARRFSALSSKEQQRIHTILEQSAR